MYNMQSNKNGQGKNADRKYRNISKQEKTRCVPCPHLASNADRQCRSGMVLFRKAGAGFGAVVLFLRLFGDENRCYNGCVAKKAIWEKYKQSYLDMQHIQKLRYNCQHANEILSEESKGLFWRIAWEQRLHKANWKCSYKVGNAR